MPYVVVQQRRSTSMGALCAACELLGRHPLTALNDAEEIDE